MPRPRKADRGSQAVARLAYRPDSGASMCAPELDEALDAWACGTLWNAVWDPGVLTVAEAACLKRSGCWWRMATDDAHEVERRSRDA